MKRIQFFFLSTFLMALIFSCQRELHFETGVVAEGVLKTDGTGNCSPITVAGTYTKGKALDSSNYMEVDAQVTSSGTFLIKTNTINGYSFQATGNFNNAGSYTIRLFASGKPLAAGIDNLNITYNSSNCHVSVHVEDSSSTQLPAGFTLAGSPNACMNADVKGIYVQGILLDTSHRVNILLNVISPGTFNLTTNTVNGYKFSGSGIVSGTGLQTVTLSASGTPVGQGIDIFQITAGSSTCHFSDTVVTSISVANNDYFPLTQNSFWVYDDLSNPGDSIKRTVIDSAITNGRLYKLVEEQLRFSVGVDTFRKTGSDYFEYASVDKYTGSFSYSPRLIKDIPFMKENLNTGDTWISPTYDGTASFGQIILLRYAYACSNASGVVTLNGKTFVNVYMITLQPQIASVGHSFGPTSEYFYLYYAKGIGLIYAKKTYLGFTQSEIRIRRWSVY